MGKEAQTPNPETNLPGGSLFTPQLPIGGWIGTDGKLPRLTEKIDMNPSSMQIQFVFFLFALLLFLFAALNPNGLIRVLGRGRVVPSQSTLLIFRIIASVCVLGTIYRLVSLLRN